MDDGPEFADYLAIRQRSLLQTAWLLTGDWQLAEDLVQTALVKGWLRWPRILAGGDPERAVDLRDALRRVLPQLPPRQRAVLVLRYCEDLSEIQTAVAMGCSVGMVKSQSSKALARLWEILGDRVKLEEG